MKKSLQSKLMKYSLTAVAVVAAGANTNAQVQYSGLVDTSITNSYNLDLNGDGTDDFEITINHSTTSVSGSYKYGSIRALSSTNQWLQFNPKNKAKGIVRPLSNSFMVSSSAVSWGNNFGYLGYTSNGSFSSGPFIGQGDKYIGVKIINSKVAPNYGWIRINIPSQTDNLVVRDWAFELTPGTGILAGNGHAQIDRQSDNLNISFGPNPTSGYLKISADDNYKVEILDMTGKIIAETQMNNNSAELDLSNQQAGIYIARLTNDNITKTVKIVKK